MYSKVISVCRRATTVNKAVIAVCQKYSTIKTPIDRVCAIRPLITNTQTNTLDW